MADAPNPRATRYVHQDIHNVSLQTRMRSKTKGTMARTSHSLDHRQILASVVLLWAAHSPLGHIGVLLDDSARRMKSVD